MVRLASGGESRKGDSITHAASLVGVYVLFIDEVEDEDEE
jgi:hypothetical protein